ncbi:MAG: hypothetical protein WCT52_03455 [Candidatus Micrarchaeia archaeon]
MLSIRNTDRNPAKLAGGRFLVFLVLALCAVLAIQLGVFEQDYQFQQSLATVSGNCLDGTAAPAFAFAKSDEITLPTGAEAGSAIASFEGGGKATGVSLSGEVDILSLSINGQEICSPCAGNAPYKFAKAQEGALHVVAKTAPKAGRENATAGKSRINIAFVDNLYGTTIQPEVGIRIAGGWKSVPNTQIPSSVYGTDAPFHLNRARVLPEYLSRLEWPYAGYTFLSVLPPAMLNLAFGTPPEYAYKLWQIALFFFPVAIFYLFSRKLARGNDAVFAAASLLYLCFPVTGLLTGGGPDLFLYGMTAHSLATYLSLLFFFYAYEYAAEKKRGALVYATLFFMLAFLSNQRIIVALGILAFVAAIPALARMDFRRIALLAICLLCAVLWNALPFMSTINAGKYGALGGANISGEGTWVVAVLQSGYLVLPFLFLAGMWEAHKNRDLRLLLLAGGAVLVLLFTTSPQVNRLAPFVDGIRFMPSFFLPAFLLAGMGAYFLWRLFIGAYERVSVARKWDKVTYGGALVMAVFLPAAAVFFAVSATSTEFYVRTVGSMDSAQDYVSQQQAYAIAGSERLFFIAESRSSQYPVYERNLQGTYVVDFGSPDSLAQRMRDYRLRYVVLGSTKHALEKNRASTVPRYEEYLALKGDLRFEEMPLAGGDRLFMLKDGERGEVFFAQGADITGYSVRFDRATFTGTCNADSCSIAFFAVVPPLNECAVSGNRCTAEVDADRRMVSVQGIPRGDFRLFVSPKNQEYVLPLALASALMIGACYILSKDD